MEGTDGHPGEQSWERLDAYAYLTATESRAEYVTIMRVFCSTLLADLSVPELLGRLREAAPGSDGPAARLDADTLAARLEQLVRWGNLLRSSHAVRAASISEYQRARSRYQLTPLGERVQRHVEEVMAEAGSAREVSAELLALVDRGLRELAELAAAPGGADPAEALERISTLFAQFGDFAESVRDFYAYLGQVLSRFDLDTGEYQGFKQLLLDYVEAITSDVSFHAPRIRSSLTEVWPQLPGLLHSIDELAGGLSGLTAVDAGTRVQRSRGRELADWEGLRAWFTDTTGRGSQVDELRDATLRALQSLLANAKRMLRASTGEISRRGDLLRLATWFDSAGPEEAHDLAVAAFGLYGARHLGVAPDADGSAVPAYQSWWSGPVVEVPVALREQGTRTQRGRAAAAEDHRVQKRHLLERARRAEATRRAAAAELRSAAPALTRVRLSGAALSLLLELLSSALGRARLDRSAPDGLGLNAAEASDLEADIRLLVAPARGARTAISSADGDLVIEDLELTVTGFDAPGVPRPRPEADAVPAEVDAR
jgi:uncharacterized protein (TIGR02677 family)